jgi:hypothetical protein
MGSRGASEKATVASGSNVGGSGSVRVAHALVERTESVSSATCERRRSTTPMIDVIVCPV